MELSRGWTTVGHSLCLLLSLSVMIPMILVLGTSFKPNSEVYSATPWPMSPTIANYMTILTDSEYLKFFLNSIINSVLRVSGQLAICILTAYAFARFRFPGRDYLFFIVLGAMMIPPQLTVIPNYILIANLGWFDTFRGLVIPVLAMPFGVFLLRQHMMAYPQELYDAAEIDGAGHWRALWLVVIPNLRPALAALTIILFIDSWNDYFWPLIVTETSATQTIQIGLRRFLQEELGDQYNILMAAVSLASLPALAVFFIFQRQVHLRGHQGLSGASTVEDRARSPRSGLAHENGSAGCARRAAVCTARAALRGDRAGARYVRL